MSAFAPRWEVLPPVQMQLWAHLAPCARLGFVLYCGTTIALRLGHGISVDFDLFSEKPLDRTALQQNFPFLDQARLIQERPDTLTYVVSTNGAGIKISFFGDIRIGRVGVPDQTPDGVMEVASSLDLLATKLK